MIPIGMLPNGMLPNGIIEKQKQLFGFVEIALLCT